MTQQVIGWDVCGYKYCDECGENLRKGSPKTWLDPIFEEDDELYRCDLCNCSIMKEEES